MKLLGEWATPQGILPNQLQDEAVTALFQLMFQSDDNFGVNFYAGVCGNAQLLRANGLSALTDEPIIGVNGYARQQLIRNNTDFPTIGIANGFTRVVSIPITFTASGGAWDKAFSRLFLCNAATGFSGILISFSTPLAVPIVLENDTYTAVYTLYVG